MSDISVTISIDKLLPTDFIAIINNLNPLKPYNIDDNDLGRYFDFLNGTIINDIIDQSVESKILIKTNSNLNELLLDISTVTDFIDTLIGRPITVYTSYYNKQTNIQYQKINFKGFISNTPSGLNHSDGGTIELTCISILGQLGIMTSNGSWNSATRQYGNIFSTISANQVNYQQLLSVIRNGTLSSTSNLLINDGSAKSLPSKVWALIIPDKTRLEVLKEILTPYSRIIYQKENGDITIQPLFIDDKADDIYSVNYYSNNYNWISISGINNASKIPNRIDVIFGTTLPIPLFGSGVDPNIFASAPRISSNNKIENTNISTLNYANIYKSSARLYNSGLFIMPKQSTITVDNSMLLNQNLLNLLTGIYNTKDLFNSIIYKNDTGNTIINTLPQLYAQMYLAMENVTNYNATVVYDYLKVIVAESPLGKIINIDNFGTIDYPSMLVSRTQLNLTLSGSTYEVDTVPLLSITGVWYTK